VIRAPFAAPHTKAAPLVLVADEDPQTLELLSLVFTTEHFRVLTAVDGDEVIRRALADRPDLVVLEVRLPKRNGFEVCDYLRHDPEDPQVPVMFVSGSADASVRAEGLVRGADDFLSKPFTPGELLARARRLLARSAEMRAQRRRGVSLERDLGRSQEETRRVSAELARERRLREMAFGFGRDLLTTLDPDALAERALAQAARQLGCGAVALLAPDGPGGPLAPRAFRGAGALRFAGATLPATGELAAALAGLGRPATLTELERWPGLRTELAPLLASGVALLAPLKGAAGLEGVIVADERIDGDAWTPEDRLATGALCELAATALLNARRYLSAQDRALALGAARAQAQPGAAPIAAEAAQLAAHAAEGLELPARERALLEHAVAFGAWAWGDEGRARVRALAGDDPSRRVEALLALIQHAETLESDAARSLAERRATLIAAAAVRYQVARRGGRSVRESWLTAQQWSATASDPALHAALGAARAAPRREHAA
jgi:DNA-binding response OmpR family regulator